MEKPSVEQALGFTRSDISRLRKAVAEAIYARSYVRLRAVLLVAEGYTIASACSIVERDWSTVYRWVRRYLQTRETAILADAPRTGRPRTAVQITDSRILKELQRNPATLGYYANTWTVATLAHRLNSIYGCAISSRTLYRRMKQMDLTCKRPKYFYEEKDPNRAQKKGPLPES